MHMFNPRLFFLLLIALFSLIWNPGTSPAEALGEYQVKATFLYHFSKFVDWPASTFKATNGYLRICVMGKDPFGVFFGHHHLLHHIHHPKYILINSSELYFVCFLY